MTNPTSTPATSPQSTEEIETLRCLDALSYVLKYKGPEAAQSLVKTLCEKLKYEGIAPPTTTTTPYINTIPPENEPEYPGDIEKEKRIASFIRWNAMAMVINANRDDSERGGHISSYASSSTLQEVGFNHFFRGNENRQSADQIFFQGHASPGNYARAFLEGRLPKEQLHLFRQELADKPGLSSYPHPYLMPDFWQFPTVSMGLGPIMAIYQARFNRYLHSRNLLSDNDESRVWCFVGDGETDEPETLGALSLASREKLNNLIFVVNCNLQRLDGPVRGNGKIIQELEAVFTGAGWNVIKVVWGHDWDPLLKSPHRDKLIKRMEEAVDGDYQKYIVEPGSYTRKHFFGTDPDLKELANQLTDSQIKKLLRGGHDRKKVYAAYKAATESTDKPTVILAKTVKGYGLGEAGEGKNISHQQKKMNEKELRDFKTRFDIPISDEEVVETPFYKPSTSSPEIKYLLNQRKKLGGFLPKRTNTAPPLPTPDLSYFSEFLKDSGQSSLSTTMAFVRILSKLLRHKELAKHIVPIIPDEGRTFGMEALFREIGIYAPEGQLYEPVDIESLLYYRESKDGQILEEGINESGSMASFIAAGTSYATHNVHMIPFYIYYSMFGFQRIGDLMWLAGDIRAKGFLLGGTAGRTTLNGEGLQHQDGHSHVLASTIPNLMTYDPAYRYEIAVIIQNGLKRMIQDNEDIFYYLTIGNENYEMREMPKDAETGILNGMYQISKSTTKQKHHVQLLGSGSILREALRAQEILETHYNVSSTTWSVTNYKRLRTDAIETRRWNMLNPTKKPKQSYIETLLQKEKGPFIAASDYMRIVPDQIHPWVPGGLYTLGTDGFGRSSTRSQLRRFFEVDAESIVIAALTQLVEKGQKTPKDVQKAIKDLGVDPNKTYPSFHV